VRAERCSRGRRMGGKVQRPDKGGGGEARTSRAASCIELVGCLAGSFGGPGPVPVKGGKTVDRGMESVHRQLAEVGVLSGCPCKWPTFLKSLVARGPPRAELGSWHLCRDVD